MFRCLDCGKIFQDDELIVDSWQESRGEFWGMPCSETMYEYHCPFCDSEEVEEYYGNADEEEEDAQRVQETFG